MNKSLISIFQHYPLGSNKGGFEFHFLKILNDLMTISGYRQTPTPINSIRSPVPNLWGSGRDSW
jgi:hypothetical protein